jgi:excinuclease ABC subunit B
MGRAARHQEGSVILYADKVTKSMQIAMDETSRRRQAQEKYNQDHQITPQGINKPIREKLLKREKKEKQKTDKKGSVFLQINQRERLDLSQIDAEELTPDDKQKLSKKLKTQMKKAANELDYELAALIRDKIKELET